MMMCAVGCLIPDELYSTKLEEIPIGALIGKGSYHNEGIAKLFAGVSATLLGDMQHIHDDPPIEDWPELMKGVADRYNLTHPPILTEALCQKK